MPKKRKGGKKKGPSFNPEEMVWKADLQQGVFPNAALNVVKMLNDKTFPVIYEDMKHKWHVFQYIVKMKDLYIHKLKEDIDLLAEQKLILHQLQLEAIDKMLADFHTRAKKDLNEYERRRNAIIADRNCFILHNVKSSRSELDWLQSCTYLLQEDNKEYNEFFFQDIRLSQYEKRQQYIMEMNYYGEWVLQVMKQACERIQKIYDDYVENTMEKKALYDVLRDSNFKDEIAIEELNKKIALLQVKQKKAADTLSMTKDIASQILDLEAEKSTYDDAQKLLRKRFVTESEEDEQKLRKLSQVSSQCIQVSWVWCKDLNFIEFEELQADLKLAEDILKYALLCSKYETMIEKASPNSQFLLSIDISLDKKFSKFKQMYRLMYRMAISELETDYMGTLKIKYEKQNEALEEFVKEILTKFVSQPHA